VAVDSSTRERRVRQFEHYLGLMEHRTLQLVKSDCSIVFSVPMPDEIKRRVGESDSRFVQFAFTSSSFYLDLPDTTITLDEARNAVAKRPGFRFALDNPQKRLGERQYDPVQRQYAYSQQRAAAEDTAYVFFDLWQTSLDVWIKVKASSFETSEGWERGFSMA